MSSNRPPKRPQSGFERSPLWAKISAPIVVLLVFGGVAGAMDDQPNGIIARPAIDVTTSTPTSLPATSAATVAPDPTVASIVAATVPMTAAPTVPLTAAPSSPPSSTSVGPAANDKRFDTCKEAKANGFGPYVQGRDAEYDWYTDGDSDGTVCE